MGSEPNDPTTKLDNTSYTATIDELRDAVKQVKGRKKRVFLMAVSTNANIVRSAEIAGISRETHYGWKRDDPIYARAFEVAEERGIDFLESEAVRRGSEGVLKPVYHNGRRAIDVKTDEKGEIMRDAEGKPIGVPASIREFSDGLLMFTLRAKRRNVYGDSVSVNQRFVNKDGSDRPFLLSDADRLIAEADAEAIAEVASHK